MNNVMDKSESQQDGLGRSMDVKSFEQDKVGVQYMSTFYGFNP